MERQKSPEEKGKQAGKPNFKGIAYLLAIIIVLGLIVMYSASYIVVYRWPGYDFSYYFNKQLINIIIGLVCMVVVAIIPLKKHIEFAPFYMIGIIFLLMAVFIFPSKGGSNRWIDLKIYDLQPSELAKLVLIVFFASYFFKNTDENQKKKGFLERFFIPMGWLLLITALIALEPDLSTSIIVFLLGMMILFICGMKYSHIIIIAVMIGLSLFLVLKFEILEPYQLNRIKQFLGFINDGEAQGQVNIGLNAISSGGILGEGLALGDYKYLLPVQFTDFVFAILGEELGFVGMAFLLVLYYLLSRSLIHAAVKGVKNDAGKVIVIGYAYLILLQVVINVGVVLGMLPPTGVTLPFVSYGGSSMLALLGGFGLVISALINDES